MSVKISQENELQLTGVSCRLIPQLLTYTAIPAHRNAKLLQPDEKISKWPVMVFSHGLGGSRNAYSFILGSLASYGIIIIAVDHRDKSAPISYIRATEQSPARIVRYQRYSHEPSQDVYEARDEQLKIRLYELGLVHDAIVKIANGNCPKNLDPNSSYRWRRNVNEVLDMFADRLDVHRPGSIIWAGHSFGAATIVQLLKSTFWLCDPEKAAMEGYAPLFTPSRESRIGCQITPHSTVVLLDMWCLPLRSSSTRWLWGKPMPAYAPGGPGGKAILAVLSDAFFKWSGNLNDSRRALNPPESFGKRKPATKFFYAPSSAHLSQSDFGVLFPWLIRRVLKVEEPDRIVKLNVRAILQTLRDNGHVVADTSKADMEEGAQDVNDASVNSSSTRQDWRILDAKGGIRGWVPVSPALEPEEESVVHESTTPANEIDETEVLGEVRI